MNYFRNNVKLNVSVGNTFLLTLGLIVFGLLCGKVDIGESEKMTALRVVYQNLGLGTEVSRKYTDVMNLMESRSPHIMFISETLIDEEAWTRLECQGYTIEAMPNVSERIWAAVKDTVNYKRATEFELADFPAIWLKVGRGRTSYLICGLYREFCRPGTGNSKESRRVVNQRERWQKFLEKASLAEQTGLEIHLIGDMNLNYAKWIQNGNLMPGWRYQGMVEDLHDQILNKGFVQTVTQITRVSGKWESILDLHITNRPEAVKPVMLTGDTKSDHLALTVTRKAEDQVADPVIEGRSWSKVDWWDLREKVNKHHLDTLKQISMVRDVNELTNRFTAWANVLLDDKTPVKRTVFKTRYNPWMNPELLKLIKEKKKLLKQWQRTKLDVHRERWKRLKCKVSNESRKAAHKWWEEQLMDGIPSDKLWVNARRFIGEKTPGAPSQIIVDGRLINDPEEVANGCMKALMKKVDDLTDNIPREEKSALEYTREYVASLNYCTFEPPSCNLMRGVGYREVKKAIKGLKYTDAASHDHISTRFVKMLRKPLLHVMTMICNRSFQQQTYPDVWKLARVCLLCKDSKEKTNPLKYRPVSVLPGPSKVLEKVVVDRLVHYMETTQYFPDAQHGYRANRSCQTAVLSLQDEILRDLENGIDSAVVFCDLSAAFDTLDHESILAKMEIYGFTPQSVAWYRSYLSNRAQYCMVGGCKSKQECLKKGCPQGSLSGPQIFSLVFGDIVIVKVADGVFMIIYADDLTIKFKLVGNVQIDEILIKRQMEAIQRWMNSNKLVFNGSKTELLVVSNKRHGLYKDLKLTMDGAVVHQKMAVRMLGLYLTHNLRQDYFIHQMKNNLVSFLNHRLSVLYKLRRKCGDKQFKLLATGLLTSKIVFGISYYGQTTEVLRDKIRMIMNKMVRLSTNSSLADRRRTKDLYKSLEFLTWDSIFATQDLNLLWKMISFNTPKHLSNKLTTERDQRMRGIRTRATTNPYYVPLTRDNQGIYKQRSDAFLARALRRAENLDKDVHRKMTMTLDMKKRKKILKTHFLEKDFGS